MQCFERISLAEAALLRGGDRVGDGVAVARMLVEARDLGVVYPAGNEWAEESIEYTQIEEVEVRRPSA